MTNRYFYRMLLALIPLAMSACNNVDTAQTLSIQTDADLQINVTSDLATPGKVKVLTFVPNSVASWLGAIVLLTEDGGVYRTDTQSSKPIQISAGPYSDIFGFAREAQPGVFLALDKDGSVDAFIEIDDAGNFGAIPLTYDRGGFTQFCSDSSPQDENLWVIAKNGSVKKLTVDFQDNKIVELSEDDTIDIPKGTTPQACTINASEMPSVLTDKGLFSLRDGSWQSEAYPASVTGLTALPGAEGLLSSRAEPADIILTDVGISRTISLSDGLSIRGTEYVSYVTATEANMGSTFASGAVIAVDNEEQRFVMVALDYLLNELKSSE